MTNTNLPAEGIKKPYQIWIVRSLIVLVFAVNVLCAIQFVSSPEAYINHFDLTGEAGIVVIQSLGILFLMWNVPYAIAIYNPYRYSIALLSAVVMQLIGFIGESWVYVNIQNLINTKTSLLRFMIFDFSGFILLTIAMVLIIITRKNGR